MPKRPEEGDLAFHSCQLLFLVEGQDDRGTGELILWLLQDHTKICHLQGDEVFW